MRWFALLVICLLFAGCVTSSGAKYSKDTFKGIDDPGMTFDVFSEDGKTVKWWCEIRNDDASRRFYTVHLTFQTTAREFGDIEFVGSVEGGKSEKFVGQSGNEFDKFNKPIAVLDEDLTDPRKSINGMAGGFPSNKPAIGLNEIKPLYTVISLAPPASKSVIESKGILKLSCDNSNPDDSRDVSWQLSVTNPDNKKMKFVISVTITSDAGETKRFDVPCTVAAGKTETPKDVIKFSKAMKKADGKAVLKSAVPAK